MYFLAVCRPRLRWYRIPLHR